MLDSKYVDIVIPVYNKLEFLDHLSKKLRMLPTNEFNIIFVDDGSTDGSLFLLRNIVRNVENFYLIEKINGGVSSARNKGLNNCVSKYVWFVDPDDSIHDSFFEDIFAINNIDSDIVVFDYTVNLVKKNLIQDFLFKENGFYDNNYFLNEYDALKSKDKNMNLIWNKWYRRSFIKEIKFNENIHLGEDRCFNLQVFSKNGKTYFSKKKLYEYYLYEANTLSTSLNLNKVNDIYKVNYFNLRIMDFKRDFCKLHIINQVKLRAKLKDKEILKFYFNEHNKLKINIFPFFCFEEVFLVFLVFTKLYNPFVNLYYFLKPKNKI